MKSIVHVLVSHNIKSHSHIKKPKLGFILANPPELTFLLVRQCYMRAIITVISLLLSSQSKRYQTERE